MYMGNEMRYLNHEGPTLNEATNKSTRDANCRGRGEIVDQMIIALVYLSNYSRLCQQLPSYHVFCWWVIFGVIKLTWTLTWLNRDRRIEAGSELFINYGVAYWTEQDEWAGAKEKVYWR